MISAAADLMYVRGVNAVALDDVRAATGTSKSQLYKHFPDGKPELVRAVVAQRAEQILAREEQRLKRSKSMSGLRRWCDALVQGAAMQGGAHGCALGNLVVELSDQDEQAHTSLLVRRDSSADSRASGSQLRSSVFPRTRSVTAEPKPAGRAANSTATTPPPTRSTRGGTCVMVAKSPICPRARLRQPEYFLRHVRASAGGHNDRVSGNQNVFGVIGIRHAHSSLAAQPAEPMKYCYPSLPQ